MKSWTSAMTLSMTTRGKRIPVMPYCVPLQFLDEDETSQAQLPFPKGDGLIHVQLQPEIHKIGWNGES